MLGTLHTQRVALGQWLTNWVGFKALASRQDKLCGVKKCLQSSLWAGAAVRPLSKAHICLASSRLSPASLTSLQISAQSRPPSRHHLHKNTRLPQSLLPANSTYTSRRGDPLSIWDFGGDAVRRPGKSWGDGVGDSTGGVPLEQEEETRLGGKWCCLSNSEVWICECDIVPLYTVCLESF